MDAHLPLIHAVWGYKGPTLVVKKEAGVIVDTDWSNFCVTFQVENVLFSPLKSTFRVEGSPLVEMIDGWDGKTPIRLENVSVKAFRAFLGAIYSETSQGKTVCLNKDEWLDALDLATRWKFEAKRVVAIKGVYELLILDAATKPYTKIALGHQFFVIDWIKAGYMDIVKDMQMKANSEVLENEPYNIPKDIAEALLHAQGQAAMATVRELSGLCLSSGSNDPEHNWKTSFDSACQTIVDGIIETMMAQARLEVDSNQCSSEMVLWTHRDSCYELLKRNWNIKRPIQG